MSQKIRLSIDLNKVSKDKLNKFDRKDGSKGIVGEFDLVALKEEKVVFENDNFAKVKTHFIAEPTKKEEESIYVGEGFVYRNKGDEVKAPEDEVVDFDF